MINKEISLLITITIVGTISLIYIIYKFVKSNRIKKTILILGPCNSGKTCLFHRLRDGKVISTVTSMKEGNETFHLVLKNGSKSSQNYNIIDYPGHHRLRIKSQKFFSISGRIIFVVDMSDMQSIQSSAEMLYELFTNQTIVKSSIPIMVFCNKSDLSPSINNSFEMKQQIENEIDAVINTRSSLNNGTDDEDDADNSVLVLDRHNEKFNFDFDAPCQVKFIQGSVHLNKNINSIIEFIQGN